MLSLLHYKTRGLFFFSSHIKYKKIQEKGTDICEFKLPGQNIKKGGKLPAGRITEPLNRNFYFELFII